MKKSEVKKIRAAILANRRISHLVADQYLVALWNTLDEDTRAGYLEKLEAQENAFSQYSHASYRRVRSTLYLGGVFNGWLPIIG